MKTYLVSFICLVISTVLLLVPVAEAELISNEDSEEAIARVKPRLMRDLKKQNLEYGSPIFYRIFKQSNELELWVEDSEQRYQHFRTYKICERSGNLGPKLREGDDQAPEGFYSTNADWMHPYSDFHLAFNIRYPNAYDKALGRTGSAIMVHGGCSSSGCFAMTDDKIEEIYAMSAAALTSGKQDEFQIHVFPFRMTEKNLKRHAKSRWAKFWANLKLGYDHFETHRTMPIVSVADSGQYAFAQPAAPESTLAEADVDTMQAATLPGPVRLPPTEASQDGAAVPNGHMLKIQ